MNFHHPYHFVPVEAPAGGVSRAAFRGREPLHVTHDRYTPGSWCGRIVCRLETVTPIFVGSTRVEEEAPVKTKVENYQLGGRIALPATSLRGMVSSVAEAASNSAMRVFDGSVRYSVRKSLDPEYVLSAIGLVLGDEETGFQLQPICIPTLRADRDGTASLPEPYWGLFPEPNLKVYVGGFRNDAGDLRSIRSDKFPYKTFNLEEPKWFALPLESRKWLTGYRLADDQFQYRKPVSSRGYVLGQVPVREGTRPRPLEDVMRLGEEQRRGWRPGVMRVLGCWDNRESSMPTSKKHEIFLPWPETAPVVVEIPRAVVEEFHELCDARTEDSVKAHDRDSNRFPLLPFEPKDTRPGRESARFGSQQRLRLKKGDLVYFGVDGNGDINEISFSAIWRKPVRNGTRTASASEFFPAELLPFSHKRETLSSAELLFGFVEDLRNRPRGETRQALALASRVRISTAFASEEVRTLKEVTLKVLATPKPPCPSLYFKPRGTPGGGFIPKMKLDARQHEAQGRKFYLHQVAGGEPWRSVSDGVNQDQQCRVTPIAAGQSFYFHIDFDNLSAQELGLLLYSLAPSDRFLHKLGMGKGIGLGSVRLTPLAMLQIDRARRYTPEGLREPRYRGALRGASVPEDWPATYRAEKEGVDWTNGALLQPALDAYRRIMSQNIRQAIELVGDPSYVRTPLLPPLVQGQDDAEVETFKWFVANETGMVDKEADREIPPQKQFLRPLVNRTDLPVFTQPEWRPRSRP